MRNACLRHQVLVVLQEAAQSLLAAHFAIAATHPLFSRGEKQNIFFALMVSLSMVVLGERRYRSPQGRLAAQNQLRQAFLFYRSHPSLRETVPVRFSSSRGADVSFVWSPRRFEARRWQFLLHRPKVRFPERPSEEALV